MINQLPYEEACGSGIYVASFASTLGVVLIMIMAIVFKLWNVNENYFLKIELRLFAFGVNHNFGRPTDRPKDKTMGRFFLIYFFCTDVPHVRDYPLYKCHNWGRWSFGRHPSIILHLSGRVLAIGFLWSTGVPSLERTKKRQVLNNRFIFYSTTTDPLHIDRFLRTEISMTSSAVSLNSEIYQPNSSEDEEDDKKKESDFKYFKNNRIVRHFLQPGGK